VIKNRWEPSLSSRLALVQLSPLVMVATAVLRRHTLFCGGVVIDKEVVFVVLLSAALAG